MGNRMAGKGAMTVLIYEGAHVRMVFTLCFWALHWAGFFFSFFFFPYPRSCERVKDGGEMGHERRSWAAIVASLGSSMLAIKHQ